MTISDAIVAHAAQFDEEDVGNRGAQRVFQFPGLDRLRTYSDVTHRLTLPGLTPPTHHEISRQWLVLLRLGQNRVVQQYSRVHSLLIQVKPCDVL